MKTTSTVRASKVLDTMSDNFYINGACPAAGKMPVNKTISRFTRDKSAVFAISDGIGLGKSAEISAYKPLSLLKRFQSKLAGIPSEKLSKALLPYFQDTNSILNSMGSAGPASSAGASIAMLVMNQGVATAVNVGNARIYSFKYGRLSRLSTDDTEAQRLLSVGAIRADEMSEHPAKNLLTGYLGIASDLSVVAPHYSDPMSIEKGDVFLLCSNGLTDVLSDDRISYIMSVRTTDERMVQRLVSEAVARGADDNVTAMLVRAGSGRKSSKAKKGIAKLIILIALVFALVFASVSLFKSCSVSNSESPSASETTQEPTPTPEFILRPAE